MCCGRGDPPTREQIAVHFLTKCHLDLFKAWSTCSCRVTTIGAKNPIELLPSHQLWMLLNLLQPHMHLPAVLVSSTSVPGTPIWASAFRWCSPTPDWNSTFIRTCTRLQYVSC
ncbi:uncharacterized protein LOC124795476 [Schistocerca piceifrons]|uniref:uncharacterized protein LOC124795476 n=1 Tax=Schistocerca piceifrons TaxID=274613 RepID=UPI001F5F5B56|nr:uncharacterized protein LOC124795476 [Schistocerca piceifrons]